MNISCIAPKKHTSIISGAIPAANLFQYISLSIRYTIATITLTSPINAPTKVASLKPIFVYDVKLNIAASYNVKKLLCVFPALLCACVYSISVFLKPNSPTMPLMKGIGSLRSLNTCTNDLS